MTERASDFLDSGMYDETAGTDESDPSVPAPSSGFAPYGAPANATVAIWKSALRPAAWLAAGVVAGAVVVAAWHSSQSSSASVANRTAAQGQLPNGQAPNGQGPNGGAPNAGPGVGGPGFGGAEGGPGFGGPGFGGPGFGGPGFGGPGDGRNGEQHVAGTVTATSTSSVTVRLTNGAIATYDATASSDIVKNGKRVSLSAIKVGDAVFLRVYPSNGRIVVERLYAGDHEYPGDGAGATTRT